MTFQDKLKDIRISAGLSQEELGNLLGYSQDTICSIEKGKRNIQMEYVKKWCEECNYPYTKLEKEYSEDVRDRMAAEIIGFAKSLKNISYKDLTLEQIRLSYDAMTSLIQIGEINNGK